MAPSPGPGGVGVLASGTNYGPTTLGALAHVNYRTYPSRTAQPPPTGISKGVTPAVPSAVEDSGTRALSRLTTASALDVCLAQILLAHPGTVVLVDYARYDGAPALIAVVRQQTGSVVVAVGPNCGLTGSDEIAAATA
jgi:hypothetical protein